MNCCLILILTIKILLILADLGSFICVCFLVSLSSKNPFKSHIIEDITKYYYDYPEYIVSPYGENNNIINTDEINLDNTENNLIQDDKKYYSSFINIDYKKIFRRKLESSSFCADMRESLERNNGKRLSYIFDLNYETIHKYSIALIVISLTLNVLAIIQIIFLFKYKK